ncbi:MAG: hypothetical protein LBH37_00070 [Oscillospiraceae bacterium]|jgi:hypothetical protein|nr:hypothetical protein [Oscillospiraceae bacterium]
MTLLDVAKDNPRLVEEAKQKCKNKHDLKKFAKEKGLDISDSELGSAYAYVNGDFGASDGKLNTEELGQVSGGKATYDEYPKNKVFKNADGTFMIQT